MILGMADRDPQTTRRKAGEKTWDLSDYFFIRMWLAEVDGRTVVAQMKIWPRDWSRLPASGLTARDLREISFDVTVDEPNLEQQDRSAQLARTVGEEMAAYHGRERSDDFYAAIAELYLDALRSEPRRAVARLARVLDEQGYPCTVGQVRSWVNLSRRHRFLTRGVQGSSGATPTPRLAAWRRSPSGKRLRAQDQ